VAARCSYGFQGTEEVAAVVDENAYGDTSVTRWVNVDAAHRRRDRHEK